LRFGASARAGVRIFGASRRGAFSRKGPRAAGRESPRVGIFGEA
jgi:hypothetical protein